MPERTVQIANRNGLHARPAAEIVKLAQAPYDASLRQYFLDNYTIEKHAERVREAIRAAIARP